MPSDPTILAFDTSAAHCAAALLRGGVIAVSRVEGMARGQAERLMPLLQEVLTEAGCVWADLDAIGVGIGPGNFTGIRISVSAARGLALGLGVPAVGVSGFDALIELAEAGQLPAIPAPREQVYVQLPGTGPCLLPLDEAEKHGPLYVCPDPALQIQAVARLAAKRWHSVSAPPAPLYVRPADAAPSRDVPPVLLDQ
ncbi:MULTISPECIES: tRNA (adenosine(37)-N6)-threonylcarbamoyltransferase complex dimerization subunit type 1 TsaB [unclassified Ruegeria]|uniref:tRNA (adenosine(37)-N6)-threonylcarbamoyltransferase complex dimerization subunit type 1 TsaB n=1 Tax=unclassified Ruegeria TaxID=2625375 RepID=UPI001AE76D74|nr:MULTISPECIES: tRNA (adenosine(37)-N6)-threonylcarbamoyltransferase complex dimerization subunit type 1 TsaB [unclassified Ruegeria]